MVKFPKVKTRSRTLLEVSFADGRVMPVSYEMMAAEDAIMIFREQTVALGGSTTTDFEAALVAIKAAFGPSVSVTVV